MRRLAIYQCCLAFGVILTLAGTGVVSAQPAPAYGRVELLRDSWGVPNVFAETDEGAMYGLGYACAEDRGFQMHYFLRMMQGRMAEVLGDVEKDKAGGTGPKTTAEHDRVMRMFGFASAADRVAKNLDRGTLGLLKAYSAGVNDYFAQHINDELDPLKITQTLLVATQQITQIVLIRNIKKPIIQQIMFQSVFGQR